MSVSSRLAPLAEIEPVHARTPLSAVHRSTGLTPVVPPLEELEAAALEDPDEALPVVDPAVLVAPTALEEATAGPLEVAAEEKDEAELLLERVEDDREVVELDVAMPPVEVEVVVVALDVVELDRRVPELEADCVARPLELNDELDAPVEIDELVEMDPDVAKALLFELEEAA